MIHSDQKRKFENKVMHELCILGGSHKTTTTPYHPESDVLVERFNRTLLMMLAMFAGEHKDDWDDLLPPVTVQITFIYIDFRVCDFAFAFKTQNAPCKIAN